LLPSPKNTTNWAGQTIQAQEGYNIQFKTAAGYIAAFFLPICVLWCLGYFVTVFAVSSNIIKLAG
jgi:hypothetical protein